MTSSVRCFSWTTARASPHAKAKNVTAGGGAAGTAKSAKKVCEHLIRIIDIDDVILIAKSGREAAWQMEVEDEVMERFNPRVSTRGKN